MNQSCVATPSPITTLSTTTKQQQQQNNINNKTASKLCLAFQVNRLENKWNRLNLFGNNEPLKCAK